MNILITGGLGFVGSNLVAEFLSRQHKVFVLDNYFTGTKDNRHEGANYPLVKQQTFTIFIMI